MSLTATNRFMNYGTCSFGGTPITGVTGCDYDAGISDKREGSDGDAGPTVGVVDFMEPTITLTTLNAFALQASLGGVRGILIVTILDAYNKEATGGGAKVLTTNALSYIKGAPLNSRFREFATRQLVFATLWADSSTPPISVTSR